MAKLSVTVIATVIFFLISLALSHARIPLNLPANDVINRETQNPLPASDVTPTIHLPSEKASTDESHADTTNGESNTVSVTTVPLKFVRFRPINRHSFTLRSTFPLRRCRGHRHNFKPWGQRLEIPYGDDMIVSTGKNKDFDRVNLHGGVRQIPAEWVKIQRNHVHLLHHYHHHHHDEDEMEEKATRREKNGQHDGLMKRFRKFLNQFQF